MARAKNERRIERGRAPLSRFKPWPDNPRTHPPAQIDLLAKLLLRHGDDQDIVVDEDWWILKGHGRLLAASKAGLKDFGYARRFGLSAAEKVAMRIEDNQTALLSGWDRELVRGQITLLQQNGYDLGLLGFGDAQLVQFQTVPGPPGEFPSYDESVPTQHCCPACGYRWSGNPAAGEVCGEPKKNGKAKGAR